MTLTQLKDIATVASPTVALLIAVGTALWQARLRRLDLREKLYDRRCAVYYAVLDLRERLRKNESVDERQFALSVLPTHHLYGPEVVRYVSQIKHRLWKIEGEYSSAEKSKLRSELARYIDHDFEVCFDPYLELHDDRNWFVWMKSRIDGWVQGADDRLASRYQLRDGR